MRKILECRIGTEIYGVLSPDEVLQRICIYVQPNEKVCGFRTYTPYYFTQDGSQYIEVGYFLEMLYEGSKTALEVLYCPKEYIIYDTYEFNLLRESKKEFCSRKMVRKLVAEANSSHKKMRKGSSFTTEESDLKIIKYDRYLAYNASLCIRLAYDMLKDSIFNVERKDNRTLEAIREGRFKYRTIEKDFRENKKILKEQMSKYSLKEDISKDLLNNLLLKIRDV